jgi:hypothetical protein
MAPHNIHQRALAAVILISRIPIASTGSSEVTAQSVSSVCIDREAMATEAELGR